MMESAGEHKVHIRPCHGWVAIDWRGIWDYRDLLYLLVRRDFISRYAQTVLGPLWFIVQGVFMNGVFTVVFSTVAKIPTDGAPPFLFYMCGGLAWGYFSQNFGGAAGTFLGNAGLFGKVYFPRLVVPVATLLSNLVGFGLQAGVFMILWIYYRVFSLQGASLHITWVAWWLPLILVQVAALSLGTGLLLSAITVKYRDFGHVSGFLMQVWMYGTPVIYPLSQVPENWKWLVSLNPMSAPVEAFRIALLGVGELSAMQVLLSILWALALLFAGLLLFEKVERTFVDSV
jgi:lipopolysaccharide transport system permease protein